MRKQNKKLILVIFLASLIMVNFVSAFGGVVEYNTGFVCGYPGQTSCDGNNLYYCGDENDNTFWKTCQKGCVWGVEGYLCEEDKEINTNNNSIASTLIIAIGIIVGLAILGLLIRRRR